LAAEVPEAKAFLGTLDKLCETYPNPKVAMISYGPGLNDVLELK